MCKNTKIISTWQKPTKKSYFCTLKRRTMFSQKPQGINTICRPLQILLLTVLVVFACPATANAQYAPNNNIVTFNETSNSLEIDFYTEKVDSKVFNENFSIFSTPSANSFTQEVGKPMLPVYQQVVQIPTTGSFKIELHQKNSTLVPQSQLGCDAPLVPAPPPTVKNIDTIIYIADSATYSTNHFYGNSTVSLEPIGQMRGTRLARLTISPIRYNPANHLVEISSHITATITFSDTVIKAHNPLLHNLLPSTITNSKNYSNPLMQADKPFTYLVVAPPDFQQTLQPLIAWKRQEGFIVDEYYPLQATRETIKAHLQQLYNHATPNRPAPLFILLVGDVQQIPVWPGHQHIPGIDVHRTDLFYADYTGDALPDAMLGRLSVSDTATLANIIAKTLDYEQFHISDSSYLQRSLLVAGKEHTPPAPTATNGQINYLKSCIIQHDSLHDTICYYNPGSETMSEPIQNHIKQGIGFVNYTAHCSSEGWMFPLLSNSIIDTLDLENRPFVSINNCCRANDISGNCFGENLLRKYPGGAVGVIGASNETLWNEDYYWSVGGSGEPTLTPQYSPSLPGAYDRLFHTNGQPAQQQALTQGQILLAGNWAVTASGSAYSDFYWEIYSLLGDPSLMPYIGIPTPQVLYINPIATGDASITLRGTPGARVAATKNDILIGLCTISDDSIGLIATLLPAPDSLLFTSVAQFHKPLQTIATSTPPESPRLTAIIKKLQNTDNEEISQLTLHDSALLSILVRNVGQTAALNHKVQISSIQPNNSQLIEQNIDSLAPGRDTTIQFYIYPETAAAEMLLLFETGDTSTLWRQQKSIDLLTPSIEVANLQLTADGQQVTTVRPSTEYTVRFSLVNSGNGRAKELKVSAEGEPTIQLGNLDAGDTAVAEFSITTPGQLDSLTLTLTISHRADTIVYSRTFADDSTLALQQPETVVPDIEIWPNPARNTITISGLTAPTHITIYDIYGRIVDEFDTKNNPVAQYSTTHLRCGIYSIVFNETTNRKTTTTTKKLVIAR